MQNVNILFEGDVDDVDIICVPNKIAENIEYFTDLYFTWMYVNINSHTYWRVKDDGTKILNLETESFVWWLNSQCNYQNSNEKAYIVIQHTHLDPKLTTTYF